MRYLAVCAAGLCLLAMNATAGAEPQMALGMSRAKAPIVLAQAEQPKKSETVTQKVKRVWRKLTGYKFDVACPALIPLNRSTCTETGKSREDARAKCQSRNVFCGVSEAKS
jgi:hypothetical protein